jgi:hypothetical protein
MAVNSNAPKLKPKRVCPSLKGAKGVLKTKKISTTTKNSNTTVDDDNENLAEATCSS